MLGGLLPWQDGLRPSLAGWQKHHSPSAWGCRFPDKDSTAQSVVDAVWDVHEAEQSTVEDSHCLLAPRAQIKGPSAVMLLQTFFCKLHHPH